MTALFIDTSQNNEIRAALIKDGSLSRYLSKNIGYAYSEMLISVIDELLATEGQEAGGINRVFIVEGPGRFSALRTGIATSNILAWLLDIPVIAVKPFKDGEKYWQEVENCISNNKNKKKKFLKGLSPNYGKDPNITIKGE